MDTLSALDPLAWQPEYLPLHPAYQAGNALGWLSRGNKQASTNSPLVGRLYVAKSGWLLLSVPNALVRGVYDAMNAPGAELPTAGAMNVPNVAEDVVNAHISVMTADEVRNIGHNKINERGHMFGYSLGALKEITPKNIDGVSKVWAIQVSSPALSALRRSYGLSSLPNGDHPFHITVALRRKKVLQASAVSKAASDAQVSYDCACSGPCMCPETCTCKQHGRCGGAHKAASVTPPQPRVRVVMPYQGKYLMETLNNSKWPQNIGKRRFMGGGVEAGETPEQAAAREMFEELGVKIKPTAFKPLGHDPREGWQHEQYLELLKHKLKPGNFNATVGSDAVVTLSHGLPAGDDYMGPDIKALLQPALTKASALARSGTKLSRAGKNDLLPGGKADNVPDREFSSKSLIKGQEDEREHTDNDQIAKEIAKDHLSEDPRYYEKNREVEKTARPRIIQELLEAKNHSDNKRYGHKSQILRKLMEQAPQDWVIDDSAPKFQGVTHTPTKFRFHTDRTAIPTGVKAANTGSVYGDQLKNMMSLRQPLVYDHNKPVFENVANHLAEVKRRGDFMLQAKRNHQQYRAAVDPKYRYQLAMQAFNGQLEQPAVMDQIIERHGNQLLNMTGVPR